MIDTNDTTGSGEPLDPKDKRRFDAFLASLVALSDKGLADATPAPPEATGASVDDIERETRHVAYAHGRGEEFDGAIATFRKIEAAHEGKALGEIALMGLDRLVGRFRALFPIGAPDVPTGEAQFKAALDEAPLDEALSLLFEIGVAAEMLPILAKKLSKRLAVRVTEEVTGHPVSDDMAERLDAHNRLEKLKQSVGEMDPADPAVQMALDRLMDETTGTPMGRTLTKLAETCKCAMHRAHRERKRRQSSTKLN